LEVTRKWQLALWCSCLNGTALVKFLHGMEKCWKNAGKMLEIPWFSHQNASQVHIMIHQSKSASNL
jgi:hypothetical protein